MRNLITLGFTILVCFVCNGQSDTTKPSIFLDCQTNCFTTFLRQEHGYVNYKRERQGADVYILVTQQSASAGAREIQMIFDYADPSITSTDTVKYYRPANISEVEQRDLFVKNFKKGILPALLNSDIADRIDYSVEKIENDSVDKDTGENEKDPWKLWSFNLGLDTRVNGEASFSEQFYSGRFSASQVKEDYKFFIFTRYSLNQSTFTLSDGEEVKSENRRSTFFTQYVKSISPNWSLGARASAGSSSFGNTDFEALFKPAIEYNIFPYSESSTKRFSFLYSVGIEYRNYTELTVFDKLEETRWRQGLDIEYILTQKWGEIEFDIEFDQYLHDLSLYSISFNPNIELNLVRGLSLEFGGDISFVGDRINISKGEISDQDIILQNRQLDTNYSYFSYVGFNYRFGTRNNNIVNPRF